MAALFKLRYAAVISVLMAGPFYSYLYRIYQFAIVLAMLLSSIMISYIYMLKEAKLKTEFRIYSVFSF